MLYEVITNGDWALVYLNRSTSPKNITQDWKTFKVTDDLSARTLDTTGKTVYVLENLWVKNQITNTKKTLKATIPAHDVLCFRVMTKYSYNFV